MLGMFRLLFVANPAVHSSPASPLAGRRPTPNSVRDKFELRLGLRQRLVRVAEGGTVLIDQRIEVPAGGLACLLIQDCRDGRESRVRIRENSG